MSTIHIFSTDGFDDKESGEEDQSLMAKESSDLEDENFLALMANSDSIVNDDDQPEIKYHGIKDNTYSKKNSLSSVLINAYQHIFAKKDQLMNKYVLIRFDNQDLEVNKEILKNTI